MPSSYVPLPYSLVRLLRTILFPTPIPSLPPNVASQIRLAIQHGSSALQRGIHRDVLVDLADWAEGHEQELRDRDLDPATFTLAFLLERTNLSIPQTSSRPPTPAILELRRQHEQMEYERMIASVSKPEKLLVPFSDPSKDPVEDWKMMKKEIGAIINVCASMIALGFTVWWIMSAFSAEIKILASLLSAFAIGAIETFLYVRFFENIKAGSRDELKDKTVKQQQLRDKKHGSKVFKVE